MATWLIQNPKGDQADRRISYGSNSSKSSSSSEDEGEGIYNPPILSDERTSLLTPNGSNIDATSQRSRPTSANPPKKSNYLFPPDALGGTQRPSGAGSVTDPLLDNSHRLDDLDETTPWTEFWLLLKSSVPVILAYTLQSSLQASSILIVGRLSPEALSIAAFCYMFAMSTAFIVALGGTTALDTLASSSFTGSKNRTDLGTLLQRAFVVLGLMYVPITAVWWFSGPIFEMLGQEEYICRDGPKFLRWLIPGGLGYIYFESVKKYLQAQGSSLPCFIGLVD